MTLLARLHPTPLPLPLLFLHVLPFAVAQFRTVPAPPPPLDTNYVPAPRFSPLMGIVMVVLVVAFFLMGFCSVYFRRCAQRQLGRGVGFDFDPALNFGLRRASATEGGLDAAVIESFPTFVYSEVKGLKIGKGSLECAVCLNEFLDDETLRLIPKCNHVFHPECIDSWLSSHSTCPICRAYLVPKPGELSVPYARFLVLEPDAGSQPASDNICIDEPVPVRPEIDRRDVVESPEGKLMRSYTMSNQRQPARWKSSGWRFTDLFPRSHSTGHSLVQPGEDTERFTLRLPEEVRNELLNSTLNRTRSCAVFPRSATASTRRGYRSGGTNHLRYNRFHSDSRLDQSGCFPTSPMISGTGSARSLQPEGRSEPGSTSARKELLKSIKWPLERLKQGGGREETIGGRSSDRLKPEDSEA